MTKRREKTSKKTTCPLWKLGEERALMHADGILFFGRPYQDPAEQESRYVFELSFPGSMLKHLGEKSFHSLGHRLMSVVDWVAFQTTPIPKLEAIKVGMTVTWWFGADNGGGPIDVLVDRIGKTCAQILVPAKNGRAWKQWARPHTLRIKADRPPMKVVRLQGPTEELSAATAEEGSDERA